MKTTEMNLSLSLERKPLQRQILQKMTKNQLTFLDFDGNEFDDVVEENGKKVLLEYKMDYCTHKTGNVDLELITYLDDNEMELIGQENVFLNQKQHKSVLQHINLFKHPSKHIKPNKRFYFLYSMDFKDNNFKSLLFDSKLLSIYFQETYMYKTMIMTKTFNKFSNREWHTISILYPLRELISVAKRSQKMLI